MRIEVISVEVANKGKYRQATVNYKTESNGKVDAKKVMSFVFKDVFNTLSAAKQGDLFEVTLKKNEQSGYWDWTEVAPGGKNTGAEGGSPKAVATAARSSYETPEERARRQVYIVRQSSIGAAIEVLKAKGTAFDTGNVVDVAKEFEKFVFSVPEVEVT